MSIIRNRWAAWAVLLVALFTHQACTEEKAPRDVVVIHQLAEPQSLNPSNSRGAESTIIYYGIFQELLNIDFKTLEIVPVLAKARPSFTPVPNSDLMEMAFEIREVAKWDNGTPITAEDVAFSLKTIKVPQTDNGFKKPIFNYIKDIKIYADNPRKFAFIVEPYMHAEAIMGDLHILPRYVYDADNILADYSIADLSDPNKAATFENDERLEAFAAAFNSPKFQREVVVGSGPYQLEEWIAKQRVILTKKADWWGSNIKDNHWFDANPNRIIYEVIPDNTTAFAALKSGRVNTMYGIPADLYKEECLTDEFQSAFYTDAPYNFAYDYVGFNLADPKFKDDPVTRKAMAHLLDIQTLIEKELGGYGEPIASFSHPSKPDYLSKDVQPFQYDVELAKQLLAQAGWADTDQDGVLDRVIDGASVPLNIKIITNNENTRRKLMLEMFQEAARKVGVKVEIETPTWQNFRPYIEGKKFDMFALGLIASPLESDPKQSWHSESIARGSNFVGYSNPDVDAAIDALRQEVDQEKRVPYYHIIHKNIHEDVPVIFTIALRERIAVSKQFNNVYFSGMKPNFWAAGFTN